VIPAVEFASFRLQQEYKRLIDTDLTAIHTAVLSYSDTILSFNSEKVTVNILLAEHRTG